jgi:hypothetical protein
MEDRNEELERIERELLAEEPKDLDQLMKEFLEEPVAEEEDTIQIPQEPTPAFDDPDKTEISDDPVVYCNFSNDYGKDLQADQEKALRKKKKDDNTIITLLAIAAGLSVGIISVLVYWLVKYF